MPSLTEEQPPLPLVFTKNSWWQLVRHSSIVLKHHDFHNHLLGRAGDFISGALRMKVGFLWTFKFLFYWAFRDVRPFNFFQERFVHQNGQVCILESILEDCLPKISVKEATEQLRNKNPGGIIQRYLSWHSWEELLRFAEGSHSLTLNFTKRNSDQAISVLDDPSEELLQMEHTQNPKLLNTAPSWN